MYFFSQRISRHPRGPEQPLRDGLQDPERVVPDHLVDAGDAAQQIPQVEGGEECVPALRPPQGHDQGGRADGEVVVGRRRVAQTEQGRGHPGLCAARVQRPRGHEDATQRGS